MPIRDHNPSGKFPAVVIILIILNVLVFLFELSLSEKGLGRFINTYALVPSTVNFSQISTLSPFITSMFLHGSILHIGSNMLFLWVFGDNIEAAVGRVKFIFFYLVGGILAAAGQFVFMPISPIPLLGASGAIAAVLGAYLVLYPRARVDMIVPIFFFPAIIPVPASFMLIYWFIIQVFSGAASIVGQSSLGGIAFIAHAIGFIAGFILIRLFKHKEKSLPISPR